tara:strand:+ start:2460 stop:2768 length:309 start_codon:yes stop_codon:yes gene_type:complete
MARFFGEMTGVGATVNRVYGTDDSGLDAVVRTWDIGVTVEASVQDGDASIRVYATGGSSKPHAQVLLATLAQGSDGYTIAMEDTDTVMGIISTIDQESPTST